MDRQVYESLSWRQASSVLDGRIDGSVASVQLHSFDLVEGVELGPDNDDNVQGHHLVYVLSGAPKGHFLAPASGSGRSKVDWGALAFIPFGLPVSFRTGRGPFRTCQCFFGPTEFDALAGRPIEWDPDQIEAYLDIRNPAISHVMRRLSQEVMQPGFAHEHLVDALASTIVVDLLRHFRSGEDRPQAKRLQLAPWQLRRIADYARNLQPGAPSTLAVFAELCGISPVHLARCFKRTTGRTLHTYLEAVRIERANELLAQGALSLAQIAAACGFSSQSYFSAAYRRATGESPGQARARLRGSATPARSQKYCKIKKMAGF